VALKLARYSLKADYKELEEVLNEGKIKKPMEAIGPGEEVDKYVCKFEL
jgi:hypothetical protein